MIRAGLRLLEDQETSRAERRAELRRQLSPRTKRPLSVVRKVIVRHAAQADLIDLHEYIKEQGGVARASG